MRLVLEAEFGEDPWEMFHVDIRAEERRNSINKQHSNTISWNQGKLGRAETMWYFDSISIRMWYNWRCKLLRSL